MNPFEFSIFGTVRGYPEVHADGEIWVEALWEVRAAYLRQFGEQEGRRRVRVALVDAMKLAPIPRARMNVSFPRLTFLSWAMSCIRRSASGRPPATEETWTGRPAAAR